MRRFPEKDYILPEDALQQCLDAGYRPLTGAEFALERANHNKKGSSAWKVFPHTDTLVGVGLFSDQPTLLVRHGDHVLSTPDGYRRLRAQGLEGYKFKLQSDADRLLWNQYCEEGLREKGSKRKTWVIQDKALEGLVSKVCDLEDAPNKTAMVPLISDLSLVVPYSQGHLANIGSNIGVFIDKGAISSRVPLVCPLVFGLNLSLNGYCSYYVGCVVGVSSGAEGATQNIFKPRKGSPLALLLETK